MSVAPVSVATLAAMKARGERIASLTCYDACFARLLDRAGVDLLLVGDSLGMVLQGHATTVPVTVEQMAYHGASVARGRERALLVVDLPFMAAATPERALDSAARLMQEGGAQVVKLEGGEWLAETVRRLSEQGVPVCAHLGLLPQSVNRLGGYRFQGRDETSAERIRREARVMEEAGASLLVLECVPAALAGEISRSLSIPVIGIGAGAGCDGQVLVLHDMLGLNPGRPPSFSRDFMPGCGSIGEAVAAYVAAVRDGSFPAAAETPY
ncbi:3-methyl-2-oxobutanoate hydroxymethyltransferase [Allochromatium vinosum]|uniref:3-methyl-2-oxobutanoate hydroxymethyltransferase n=1 Tax=Allochromatium vinosum (strain ATCC 17899 / DSM 180 / NBRC 103801 / NCIMB 10441 / D) TaxID=572477 RepID=D3RQ55_ALLVD|nr:3-methyl-2-oxobutanoate hydroxymethyltransferase [Allochromatium vinosum]ADC63666.1 3-methyl-2-oxobutanoate hydroxymethyltransferase [Allochromatium vinosum DSM 180]